MTVSINDVIEQAADPIAYVRAEIAWVSDWLAGQAAAHGLNIAGFRHAVDSHGVRHIRKNHGDDRREMERGQIAVTDDDFRAIPMVLAAPDTIVFGVKTPAGKPVIAYLKAMPDGSTLLLEEVRSGRRNVTLQSMRKYPATTRSESIVSTLSPNARNDGENRLSVIDVPPGVNAADQLQRPPHIDQPRPASRIPLPSLLLGFGPVLLLPLAALAAWLGPRETLWVALALGQMWASALVLFLAGVRRGLSFFTEGGPRPVQLVTMAWLFALGLAGLLLPAPFALPALIVAVGSVALTDPRAAGRGEVPAHFARLRPPQMAIAGLGLIGLWARLSIA